MKEIFKKTGVNALITSIIFALLGVILILKPEETITTISYILGIMFILIGIYKIISYTKNKEKYNFYNYDIAYGIIAIILGILTIVYSNQIGNLFRIIIGLWIVYSAILRVNLSFKLKEIGKSKIWIYSLVISILILACGIYIMFNSGAIIVTIGAIILIYSILDIIESAIFLKNIKKLN